MQTLRINRRATDRIRQGHLWVYRSDIESTDTGVIETLVTINDPRNVPLGTALYSSASQIAARMVSRTPGLTREQYVADVERRLKTAMRLRHEIGERPAVLESVQRGTPVFKEQGISVFGRVTNAGRLVFSEADGLPGIVIDRYGEIVIVQLLTQGTAQEDVREALVRTLRLELSSKDEPLTIWERPDPRIRELEQLAAPPDGPLYTNQAQASTTTTFTLNGLHFKYDAGAGQKTGAFLDQRLNYAAAVERVRASLHSQRALDVCTYQGGFALHLAQVCERVTGVDASRAALEAADRNLALNPALQAEIDWIEADAFDLLRAFDEQKEVFDAIVLDPPAFAKSKRAAEGAARGYKELNLRAMRMIRPGGTLITNSCSHHVSLEDFTAILAAAAADSGRRVQLIENRAAAPDHPEVLTLPETRYLKCLICRVD